MAIEVHVKTVVLPGGRIEISTPVLIAGQEATVMVTVEDSEPDQQRHVIDILAALPGHQLFQNAEEADAYLREERDSWER
ncbi:MAG: hypothetical protein JO202_06590 [Ktedonobacteraceae bacterium]|nr:hypothetical protein [Ktedonobacteraceae bacterium]